MPMILVFAHFFNETDSQFCISFKQLIARKNDFNKKEFDLLNMIYVKTSTLCNLNI